MDLDSGNEGPPHKLGNGPVGKGPPLRVRRKGEWRDIVDGGGLCSPEKWPISQRRFPDSEAVRSLQSALVDSVERFEQDVATRGVVYALALGKFWSSPFSSEQVVACRSSLESALKAGGIDIIQNETDAPQTIRVRWVQAVALAVGDPDAHFASMVAGGVRAGALSSLPRTPAISEKKTKWVLPEECIDSWDMERWRGNSSQLSARASSASSSRKR